MRPKLTGRKELIKDFIQDYYLENDRLPSEHDITVGTGISAGSVHRLLVEMRESGELISDGSKRSVRTEEIDSASRKKVIPVVGEVACGEGVEEEQRFIEYIHLSESLVGHGELFGLIAKGKSMVDVGVYPGDYVIVRKQHTAENKELVIALLDGRNNLKQLIKENGQCFLRSRNSREKEKYPDIIPEGEAELQIQGIAVGVYHDLTDVDLL